MKAKLLAGLMLSAAVASAAADRSSPSDWDYIAKPDAAADNSESAATTDRLTLIDRPYQGDRIALSPNGNLLAYSEYGDGRLDLRVDDLVNRTSRLLPLLFFSNGAEPAATSLRMLRWAGSDRLILESPGGQVAAIDADGGNPIGLWSPGDNGLISTMYLNLENFGITAEPPRLLPPDPDDPDHVLLESSARIGPEVFSNLFRIDIRTGDTELANPKDYRRWQVALYGPGDLLFHAPPPEGSDSGNDMITASSAADMVSSLEAVAQQMRRQVSREDLQRALLLNPDTASLEPEQGGAVSPDSSSTGRMLYDRQGRPRVLYEEPPKKPDRRFSYTKPNQPPMEPNLVPTSLDAALRNPTGHEFEITPENYFGERSYPLAFDYDPNILYYASNIGRDTFGIYSVNLKTGERQDVLTADSSFDFAPLEPDYPNTNLVFDDHARRLVGVRFNTIKPITAWLDPELADFQALANATFPYHDVEVLSWSDDRNRFLLRVSSAEDPGAYVTYDRKNSTFDLALLRAPWLADQTLHASSAFAFETPAGVRLTGYLTLPDKPKVSPPPLLLYCQGGLWDGPQPGFNREAQLLADLGVVVMRVNFRGTAGHGRASMAALRQGIDSVPIDDLLASIDWISDRYKIDRTRVVIMGEGFGGYLALRALQLHPDAFRCAITINAPTNLSAWATWRPIPGLKPMKPFDPGYDSGPTTLDFRSLVRHALVESAQDAPEAEVPQSSKVPLLMIEDPKSPDITPISAGLARIGIGVGSVDIERLGISGSFEGGSDETRARILTRIEEFLNLHLYEFGTKIGPLRVIGEEVSP